MAWQCMARRGSHGWECCVPVGYLRVSRGLAVMVMHGGARRGKARSGVAVEVVLGQGLFCYGGVRFGSRGSEMRDKVG